MLGTLVGLQSSSELASQLSASLDQFESRYASILAREIIDNGESQGMSLHVKTCGTPSRLLRAFQTSSQQELDVNQLYSLRYPSAEAMSMPTQPLNLLVRSYTREKRTLIADVDAISAYNATYRRRMLLDEYESSSFTELEGCMLLHVEEYEHARAVVLLPTLFWIFMPFALMLYDRYLPQEFAEQTAISSLQCQRMLKQLPMVEAANASEDVKRYFVATGLLKDFALSRDAAGKVSHT